MKFSSFVKYFALTQLGSHAFLVHCQLLQQTLLCDLPPAASIRIGTWTAARPSPTLAISETEKLPDNIENHSITGRMPLIYHPDWICWYRWGDHDNWTQWLWFVGVPERIALSTILLYSSISIATPIVILALSNLFHCRNRLWFCDQPGVVSPWLTVLFPSTATDAGARCYSEGHGEHEAVGTIEVPIWCVPPFGLLGAKVSGKPVLSITIPVAGLLTLAFGRISIKMPQIFRDF